MGNSKNVRIHPKPLGSQLAVAIHSAAGPAGQPCSTARRPQPCARSAASALNKPNPQNSQPIVLPGLREAISVPAPTSDVENTA